MNAMKMNWRTLLVTVGGLGFMRPAPGTWGSLPPAGVAWLLLLLGASDITYHATMAAIAIVFSVICVALGAWAETRFGRKDASQIVADETAGQAVALLMLSDFALRPDWTWLHQTLAVGASFILFRIFDIVKPPPAHQIQRAKAGWGVLLDDLFAGAYAGALMYAALYFFPAR